MSELDDTRAELARLKARVEALGNKWIDYSKIGDPMMYWSSAGEHVMQLLKDVKCKSVLIIKGAAFECDWPVDEYGKHDGWAHTNAEAEAVWGEE